ncbi:MAG: hypothetical protein FJ225_07140 [Lentisphaerae bacterium]|nr:hypothetical protein [Lentisphaerota bacterium]
MSENGTQFGRATAAIAVAIGLLAAGCEMDDPTKALAGGDLIGTWGMQESAVKAAGAPFWTSIRYGERRAAAQGMFGRIAFFEDNTCYGELITDGRPQNFDGTWTVAGTELIVNCGGTVVAGEYGVENDRLVFTTTRADGDVDVDVTFIMKRAPALERPPAPDAWDGDGNGDGDVDGGSRDSGGSSGAGGSNTFLWKPESENDGNAVTLFPAKYRLNDIAEVYIKGGDRDGDKPRSIYWPDGRNGNRVHARWSAEGEDFGEDFDVVLVLDSGDTVSWTIDDGAERREQ